MTTGIVESPDVYAEPSRKPSQMLTILENFQGEVPDVLRAYGAPATVTG